MRLRAYDLDMSFGRVSGADTTVGSQLPEYPDYRGKTPNGKAGHGDEFSFSTSPMDLLAGTAMAEYHSWGDLNGQNLFSYS
jgi:hypothetical protein